MVEVSFSMTCGALALGISDPVMPLSASVRIMCNELCLVFSLGLTCAKGGRRELLIVVACYVHAMRENRFEAEALNIIL